MKKYDSYKDSGIEWIGEIPSHWEVKKTIHYFKAEKGKKAALLTKEYCWTIKGIYPVYSGQTENNGIMSSINEYEFDFSDDGCLLSTTVGAKAMSINFIQGQFSLSQNCMVITSRDKSEISNKFFFYQFQPIFNFHRNLIPDHMQPSFRMDDLYQFKIIVPSKAEQTTIANFLDKKTTQIDDLIAKKERLIKLLEEERTAIINQAVTKGLDPTVPMKDSSIEWLGEVPEHWEVKKLKHVKSNEKNAFVDGPFGSNLKTEHFIQNGDVYVIDSGYITSGEFKINRGFKTISLDHFETVRRSECKARDIIIAKIGANFGMSGILPELDKQSLVSGNTLKLTIDENNFDLEFIHLQLLNLKTNGEIDLLVKGSAQPALSMGVMSDLPFVIPKTIDEQILVREYIKKNHERIDILISKVSNEIELLKEYKTALISEVVTGKVDVRDWVAGEN